MPKITQITATSNCVYALLDDGSLHYNIEDGDGSWRVVSLPMAWMVPTPANAATPVPYGKLRPIWDGQKTREYVSGENCPCGAYIHQSDTSTWYSHWQQGHLEMSIAPTRK